MPFIAEKTTEVPRFQVRMGPALGKADDFWALGYCPDADELERETNPEHLEFTYVFRYRLPERTLIGRVPRRIDGIWQCSDGTVLGVGDGLSYLEIRPQGITEVSLSDVPGIFRAIWGAGDDHVFACGVAPGFILYRREGNWQRLPVPEGTKDVRDVHGLSEEDVYFVGDDGQVHHFNGKIVTRLRVPVRHVLNAVVRLDPTRVCFGGYAGTLLVGNQSGWRHLATNINEPLLCLASLDGKIYYGADEKVWSSDGSAPPQIDIDFAARWLSGLKDGLVLSNEAEAKLYASGVLVSLDLAL